MAPKVKLIDRQEYWRIRRLKEAAPMLGNRPSIEMNTFGEPLIKKAR